MKKLLRWFVLGSLAFMHVSFLLFIVLAIIGLVYNIKNTLSGKKSKKD